MTAPRRMSRIIHEFGSGSSRSFSMLSRFLWQVGHWLGGPFRRSVEEQADFDQGVGADSAEQQDQRAARMVGPQVLNHEERASDATCAAVAPCCAPARAAPAIAASARLLLFLFHRAGHDADLAPGAITAMVIDVPQQRGSGGGGLHVAASVHDPLLLVSASSSSNSMLAWRMVLPYPPTLSPAESP